jgi:SAM-dependent methyltransferase
MIFLVCLFAPIALVNYYLVRINRGMQPCFRNIKDDSRMFLNSNVACGDGTRKNGTHCVPNSLQNEHVHDRSPPDWFPAGDVAMFTRFGAMNLMSKFPQWKILDLGAGRRPIPYSTHGTDIMTTISHYETKPRDGYKFTGGVNSEGPLPFQDDEFDFVWNSHNAEHVENPLKFCNEISRVAQAGCVCVPTWLSDNLFNGGGDAHKHWVHFDHENSTLVFTPRQRFLKNQGVTGVTRHFISQFRGLNVYELCVLFFKSLRCREEDYDWRFPDQEDRKVLDNLPKTFAIVESSTVD